ncbi:hypothetical protein G6F54_013791 [Rhizopus delemar]|nr:hypothetical protein G6F54_013791 [Rhizopus delemar]
MGIGNIAGVATAIAFGGPGAIFWMWVMGFLGAATSYVECTLAQIYKDRDAKGQYRDGDGEREAYDFTLGTVTDRASITVGASYVNEKSVMAGDRKISAGGPPFFSGQSATGIPGSYVRNGNQYIIINGGETPALRCSCWVRTT